MTFSLTFFQVWDKDILNPNDAIAEANLNLKSFYNRAYKNKSDRESLEQQWVAMTHPSAQGVQGNKFDHCVDHV